jgi:hypothetical protein
MKNAELLLLNLRVYCGSLRHGLTLHGHMPVYATSASYSGLANMLHPRNHSASWSYDAVLFVISRRDDPDRLYVWVSGIRSKAAEHEVMATLEQARAPEPTNVLRLAGINRGLILGFLSPANAATAADALRRNWEMQRAAEAAAAQMAAAAAAAPPPPVRRPATPPPAPQRLPSPDRAPLPQFANRSLWVGQVRTF